MNQTNIVSKYVKVEQFIRDNYPENGAKFCADLLGDGYTVDGIRQFASRKNIKQTRRRVFENPTCNLELFKNPNTPQMAYYLGLVWGDGAISKTRVNISVAQEDGILFLKMIEGVADFKIYSYKERKEGLKPIMNIIINNTILVDYLREMDYATKSVSSPKKILETIPKDLHRFFWLGLLDADGSIYQKDSNLRVCYVSAYDHDWSELQAFISSMNCYSGVFRRTNDRGNSSSISISSKYDSYLFLSYLYKTRESDGIGLERKYKKFLDFKSAKNGSSTSKLGFIGVYERSYKGKLTYDVSFRNGKNIFISGFKNAEEAAVIFDKISVSHLGHKAKTNYTIENYIEVENPNYSIPIYPEIIEYL